MRSLRAWRTSNHLLDPLEGTGQEKEEGKEEGEEEG
jgi:hypothetical protein